MEVSVKQQFVLKVILEYITMHNYPPTVRELCALVGLKSSSNGQRYLLRLKKHGLVDWEQGKSRSLKIIG